MPGTQTFTDAPPAATAAASARRDGGIGPPPLRLVLPAIPEAVGVARQLVRSLAGEEFPAADALVLCVSELVTNSVTHSLSAAPDGTFTLSMHIGPAEILVEVGDAGGPTAPQIMAGVGPDSEHGRGLWLVAALADNWGSESGPEGRVTWCTFRGHSGSPAPAPAATLPADD